jgi:hypothetical protein
MEIVLSDRAIDALKDAPRNVQQAFQKQLRFLAANLQHPSLHAKKYDEAKDIWQARVNKSWRFFSRSRMIPTGLKTSSHTRNRRASAEYRSADHARQPLVSIQYEFRGCAFVGILK